VNYMSTKNRYRLHALQQQFYDIIDLKFTSRRISLYKDKKCCSETASHTTAHKNHFNWRLRTNLTWWENHLHDDSDGDDDDDVKVTDMKKGGKGWHSNR